MPAIVGRQSTAWRPESYAILRSFLGSAGNVASLRIMDSNERVAIDRVGTDWLGPESMSMLTLFPQ